MNTRTPFMLVAALTASSFLLLSTPADLSAAEIQGNVFDPSMMPIAGAQVAAVNDVGVIVSQITDDRGHFDFNVSPVFENYRLRVTAPGFQIVTTAAGVSNIVLQLAPLTGSVRVEGSAIDVSAGEQGTSVSVITSKELRQRNEAQPFELMRDLPGMVFAQAGARGAVADLFVRGGSSNYNLVELNGIPINSFYYGGLFDFAQIPSDLISEVDVARGPQSAVYGSYAIASAINFVTRSPENGPALDFLAEGGTHDENRFALSGSFLVHGWGLAGSVSSVLTNGPVRNSDYTDQNVFLSGEHRWFTQSLFVFGNFSTNDTGEPGPYGSNPAGLFPGIDLISRSKNNTSTAGLHYQNDFTSEARLDVTAGFYLNNSFYVSPFGDSFNKDLRPYGDVRATFHVLSFWTLAEGLSFAREEMRNTFVTDTNSRIFPLRRDNEGIYLDNHFAFAKKLFLDLGVREELFQNFAVPADAFGFPPRPFFRARDYSRVNPRVAAAYLIQPGLRLHASFATGIRPPGGADLAFTNNPNLRPERTESYDVGIEQRFLGNRVSLDETYFHNRYRNLIVGLGGSLSVLSSFSSDNLAKSNAEGVEVTAKFRPSTLLSVTGNYMWLETRVLSVNGGSGLVEQYFYLGQPLLREPKQSGSAVVTLHYGKADVDLTGYFRGHDLDVEPNYGASAGLFRSGGYVSTGINVNYRVRSSLTVYANLRNALDRHYEEIYGFPAPFLNVVAGVKWSLARAR